MLGSQETLTCLTPITCIETSDDTDTHPVGHGQTEDGNIGNIA